MKSYVLAIYKEPLGAEDLIELRSLCPNLKFEKLDPEQSEAISAGYNGDFEALDAGYAYRFYHEPEELTFLFMRYRPSYIGQFTKIDEQKCVSIFHRCLELSEYHDQVYAMISDYDFEQYEFLRLIEITEHIDTNDQYGPSSLFSKYVDLGKSALRDIYHHKKISMSR